MWREIETVSEFFTPSITRPQPIRHNQLKSANFSQKLAIGTVVALPRHVGDSHRPTRSKGERGHARSLFIERFVRWATAVAVRNGAPRPPCLDDRSHAGASLD